MNIHKKMLLPAIILSTTTLPVIAQNYYKDSDSNHPGYQNGHRDRDHDRYDEHRSRERERDHPRSFNHRDNWHGNFSPSDYNRWQQGKWVREHHNGKYGWWWVTNNTWYFYNKPVYPYPVMTVPPVIYSYNTSPVANTRYFCSSTNAYYPYVTKCNVKWKSVYVR